MEYLSVDVAALHSFLFGGTDKRQVQIQNECQQLKNPFNLLKILKKKRQKVDQICSKKGFYTEKKILTFDFILQIK